jgi:cytochrome c
MRSKLITLTAISAVFITVSLPAMADEALAKSKNCMACHAVATKMVGPSYKDVAAKYAGDGEAVKKLAVTIQKGSAPGKGNWGPVPMPANTQVSEAEATKLAAWVMAQK